jgi:hypothetical protein
MALMSAAAMPQSQIVNPEIDVAGQFQQGRQDAAVNTSNDLANEASQLEVLATGAAYAMPQGPNGPVDPAKWNEVLDTYEASGMPAEKVKAFRDNPNMASVLLKGSSRALAASHDSALFDLEKQRMEADIALAMSGVAKNTAPPETFTTLTADEVKQLGLPPGSYQRGADNKISQIGGGGTSVTVNTGDGADGELNKALSKAEGDLWAGYKQAAAVSGANAADFGVLDELIKVAPQGPIAGRLAEMFPGFSSAGDAFQSIVKRIAPTLRAPGSGATSDIEYDGMLKSLPALKNSPEANNAILQIMVAKADLNQRRADVINQYQAGDISIGEARQAIAELDRTSILTDELKQALGGMGVEDIGDDSSESSPQVGDVQDGYEYVGGDPADEKSWKKVN